MVFASVAPGPSVGTRRRPSRPSYGRSGCDHGRCTPGGPGTSVDGPTLEVLRGRDVYLWPDHDPDGVAFMAHLSSLLTPVVRSLHQISWRSDNLTLLYDFFTQTFTRLVDPRENISPLNHLVSFKGKHFALRRDLGFIYLFSLLLGTDDGEQVPRRRITKNYVFNHEKKEVTRLRVFLAQGEQNISPGRGICRLRISQDKGICFTILIDEPLAPVGGYDDLLEYTNLGASRFWTFFFEFLSDKPVAVMGANMDVI